MIKIIFTVLFSLCLSLAQATELAQMIQTYQADRGALARFYTNPFSEEYFDRMQELNQEYLSELQGLDYDSFSEDGKIDYVLFRNYLEKELAELKLDRRAFDEVKSVVDFGAPLHQFVADRRRAKQPDPKALAANWNQVANEVDAQLKLLASTPKYNSW